MPRKTSITDFLEMHSTVQSLHMPGLLPMSQGRGETLWFASTVIADFRFYPG